MSEEAVSSVLASVPSARDSGVSPRYAPSTVGSIGPTSSTIGVVSSSCLPGVEVPEGAVIPASEIEGETHAELELRLLCWP